MPEEKLISLHEAAKRTGLPHTIKPKTFERETSIKPAHVIDTGVRKFYMYSPEEVQVYVDKNRPKPKTREEIVSEELENEVTLAVAAINAQATRLDKMDRGIGFLFEKMQTLSVQNETLIKKLDYLLKSLGETMTD